MVGKLKENLFRYNNTEYRLGQHGFARDMEFALIRKTENLLEFELTASEETLKFYPFHFSLRISYELENQRVKVSYRVFNPDKSDLFFSIGAHPGFKCLNLMDSYLEFDKKAELVCEKLSAGLLSGETYKLKLEDGRLQLSTQLFNNDALVFKNKQVEKVRLCSSKSNTKITLGCKDWPYFGIWAKKDSDHFVCLEPWFGIADSVNVGGEINKKEGILCVKPYSFWENSFSLEIKP